jgi:hypothetical protein
MNIRDPSSAEAWFMLRMIGSGRLVGSQDFMLSIKLPLGGSAYMVFRSRETVDIEVPTFKRKRGVIYR